MEKKVKWQLFLLILFLLAAAGSVNAQDVPEGLPTLYHDLPDPGDTLGEPGKVFDEHYSCQSAVYRVYLCKVPASPKSFITDYTDGAAAAGYAAEKGIADGYDALLISKPLKTDESTFLL